MRLHNFLSQKVELCTRARHFVCEGDISTAVFDQACNASLSISLD